MNKIETMTHTSKIFLEILVIHFFVAISCINKIKNMSHQFFIVNNFNIIHSRW